MIPARSILLRLAGHNFSNQVRRIGSQQQTVERLDNRSLIQISGKDSSEFLQGLVTNDMRLFEEGNASIYALFLNIKGRVMFDTLIYKIHDDNLFYLECDSDVEPNLKKHLTMYRLRKQVDIKPMNEDIKVWTVFNPTSSEKSQEIINSKLEGQIFPCGGQYNKSRKIIDKILVYEDPRLSDLGLRILAQNDIESKEICKHLGVTNETSNCQINYKTHRYKLGIGEGVADFPLGTALPLEINADYLHGVSFHKGCYIGQELTARTHHTGVVRKRLMPLIFNEEPKDNLEYDEKILDENNKPVGKFRAREKVFGLGLIRIVEALKAESLNIKNTPLRILKPSWWMPESQKEALLSVKSSE